MVMTDSPTLASSEKLRDEGTYQLGLHPDFLGLKFESDQEI